VRSGGATFHLEIFIVGILSVIEGKQVIGFILNRSASGIEAFTADEKPIGLFADVCGDRAGNTRTTDQSVRK
jgi:hypothetical protein